MKDPVVVMLFKDRQHLFARLLPLLILYMDSNGYEVTLGNTTAPTNHKNSLHPMKLAIDLNLFLNGKYLRSTKAHEQFGRFWKSLHPLCRWGGDFFKPDGNHYSVEYRGRA